MKFIFHRYTLLTAGLILIVIALGVLLVKSGQLFSGDNTSTKSGDSANSFLKLPNIFSSSIIPTVEKDEHSCTRILLAGVGGADHDGPNLTDSLIVANINFEKETVSLLSIPRDLFIRTHKGMKEKVNKIYANALAENGGDDIAALEYMKESVALLIGMDIQYVARINFEGFADLVDFFGGIDVNLETPFYDPSYPRDDEDGYMVFSLPSGPQKLDGSAALKYARSRHSSSDFDRAKRQHIILNSLRQKFLESYTRISLTTANNLLGIIRDNFYSDISVSSLITLVSQAKNFTLLSKTIHDDPFREGGLLYPPPQTDFGGMFVLLPNNGSPALIYDYSKINSYARFIFYYPDYYLSPLTLDLKNGTFRGGLAGTVAEIFKIYGINTGVTKNAGDRPVKTSYVVLQNDKPSRDLAEILKTFDKDIEIRFSDNPLDNLAMTIGEDFSINLSPMY